MHEACEAGSLKGVRCTLFFVDIFIVIARIFFMKTYMLLSEDRLRNVKLPGGEHLGYTNPFISTLIDISLGRGKSNLKQGFSIPECSPLELILLVNSWRRNIFYHTVSVAHLSQSDEQVRNWSTAGFLTINRVNPLAVNVPLCAESLSTVFSRTPYIVQAPRFTNIDVFRLEITNALNGIEDVVL
jgi:hypothetical protein